MPYLKNTVFFAALLGGGLIWWLFVEDKNPITYLLPTPADTTSNDPQTVFKALAKQYGAEYARQIEKLYRYETGHFKSNQYLESYSAGMVAVNSTFPFGWSSLERFTAENPQYAGGYGVTRVFSTNAGGKMYVKFPNLTAAVFFIAWFIKNIRGGDVGKWNSTDPATAAAYAAELNRVTAKFN